MHLSIWGRLYIQFSVKSEQLDEKSLPHTALPPLENPFRMPIGLPGGVARAPAVRLAEGGNIADATIGDEPAARL